MGLRKIIRKNFFPDAFLSDYHADGLATKYKTLPFKKDTKLAEAWQFAEEGNKAGWKGNVPDIRWRVHIACWAAQHGLALDGDFVECGVHTGILSMAICKYLDFAKVKKKFYLFDTYEGIPVDQITTDEEDMVRSMNENLYFDCLEIVQKNFSDYPNALPVKGRVPESFKEVKIDKIAYLSLDMNNATAERAAIEYLWPKLVSGAMVVLDDYGWISHEAQMKTMDEFAASQNVSIAHLPTGQGLLVKQ
ncbi:MAG: methyltransferase [Micavibrio sp.]|nr:MAG: methyltransferase [Micavibrio sp.]